jgi:murein DD-endopeptidase MepM/ murein hydrolase activator NlpD
MLPAAAFRAAVCCTPPCPITVLLRSAQHEVKSGDTLFGIAQVYDLKPQTLLFGNYDILYDDPHRLNVGQTLRILPMDGLLYTWAEGDGLNGVATFFKVAPEDILDWPGNFLNRDTIGDFSNPNIEVGTVLFVPNGMRDFYSWSVPIISRRDPAKARNIGPGSCGTIESGATGNGSFIFPTTDHSISGYHYDPSTNHNGVDFGGRIGNPIFAADGGVVVYAGWNDYGYGNMIVIDHGTGWQTLYAHLSTISAGCGVSVGQGDVIGAMGSTGRSSGPHLHFELMSASGGKVNPMDYLQ